MTVARGAVLHGVNQPFVIEELEWEDPRDDEVGVRVVACGVCHSDYHCVSGTYPMNYPCLPGHEASGVVETAGKNVTRVKVGDKVILSWMPSCGHCPSCVSGLGNLCDRGANLLTGMRDDGTFRIKNKKGIRVDQFGLLGGFSEYVVIEELGCIPVSQDFDLPKISIVGCRTPTGWGAVVNTARAHQGCTALVIGLGGVGFNALQGLKSVGATVVIAVDIHNRKKDLAMKWGATHYINASEQDVIEEVMKITGIGVDYAFDTVGLGEVQSQCFAAIHKGGTAVYVGIAPHFQKSVDFSTFEMALFQKEIRGSCYGGRSPFEMVPQLLDMYRAGHIKLDELITKYYRLDQINEAYDDMLAGKNICGCIRMD
jgi:Zn-dependent alcohol dehydrogenases, class III